MDRSTGIKSGRCIRPSSRSPRTSDRFGLVWWAHRSFPLRSVIQREVSTNLNRGDWHFPGMAEKQGAGPVAVNRPGPLTFLCTPFAARRYILTGVELLPPVTLSLESRRMPPATVDRPRLTSSIPSRDQIPKSETIRDVVLVEFLKQLRIGCLSIKGEHVFAP